MPIRINLLAEAQAAEEARRRDPVKRTVLVGVGLVVAMLVWMTLIMLQVRGARDELARESKRLAEVQPGFLVVSNNNRVATDLNRKADAIVKYATNRFLWGSVLDAFQHTATSNVWISHFEARHTYVTNKEFRLETNLVVLLKEPKKWYQLWAAETGTNVLTVITNTFAALTNRMDFVTGGIPALLLNQLVTNPQLSEVSGKLIATRPLATIEAITVNLKGRDFSQPFGSSISAFTNAILSHPYLGSYFNRTNTSLDPSVRPTSNPMDLHNTNAHVSFELKTVLPARARTY